MSRSALTSALDTLERSLRTQLFVRHKAYGVVLTPSGERILEMATELLRDADELQGSVDRGTLTGTVSVGCFGSLAPFIVPALFDAFASTHPGVSVRAYSESETQLMHLLASGDIEIAVGYNTNLDRTLKTVPLYDARMHILLARSSPLAREKSVSIHDLADQPLILLDSPPSRETVLSYFRDHGVVPRIGHQFQNFEVVRSLVARGYGFSMFIQKPLSDISYEGEPITVRPLTPAPQAQTVTAAWPAGRRLSSNAEFAVSALVTNAGRIKPADLYMP